MSAYTYAASASAYASAAAANPIFETKKSVAEWNVAEERRVLLQVRRYRKMVQPQSAYYHAMMKAGRSWQNEPTESAWKKLMRMCDAYREEEHDLFFHLLCASRVSPSRKERAYEAYLSEIDAYREAYEEIRSTLNKKRVADEDYRMNQKLKQLKADLCEINHMIKRNKQHGKEVLRQHAKEVLRPYLAPPKLVDDDEDDAYPSIYTRFNRAALFDDEDEYRWVMSDDE